MHWQRSTRDRSQHHWRHQQGFSLIEGLIVLLVIGIAAAFAIPNLQRVKIKTETQEGVYRVAGYIDVARSEALKRHTSVGVVYSGDKFFRVFEDWDPDDAVVTTNGDGQLNGAESVIIRKALLSSKIRLLSAPPSGDLDPLDVLFQSGAGTSYKSDGSLSSGDGAVYFADKVGNVFRLRINPVTGSPRIEKWLPNKKWSPKKEDWEWQY